MLCCLVVLGSIPKHGKHLFLRTALLDIALLTDLNLFQIRLLPMCVIVCQFNKKSFFYTIDGWCEHGSASLRSLQYRKFSSLILLWTKKFFAFSWKEVSQNHRSVRQRQTKLGKIPSRVLYFTVLYISIAFPPTSENLHCILILSPSLLHTIHVRV